MEDEQDDEGHRKQLSLFTANLFKVLREPVTDEVVDFCKLNAGFHEGEVAQAACRALVAVVAAIIAEGARTEKQACTFSEDIEEFQHNTVHAAWAMVADMREKIDAVGHEPQVH